MAVKSVHELETELEAIMSELSITPQDFTSYTQAEKGYLQGLREIPLSDTLGIQYVGALDQLSQCQCVGFYLS
jgi:hypothetical protein